MSDKKPVGNQTQTISFTSPFVQQSLDLKKQDDFVKSFAVDFTHYKALPSPIGKADRGDYRRNDGVDTVTSNGMLYKESGKFVATISNNERSQKGTVISLLDPSQMRLIMPRFYEKDGGAGVKRIYLAPGDRLYVSDKDADVKVANYQEMTYDENADNVPMFPIKELEFLIDSKNIEYKLDVDFIISRSGNIRWISGASNPGVDPVTGKGRVYSIRYLYDAYWYVVSIPHEVRMTGVTQNGIRTPERMAYHAILVREYIFHNQNNGDETNQLKPINKDRENPKPIQNRLSNPGSIAVDMAYIGDRDDEEQS